MNIVLQPVGGTEAVNHYKSTIRNHVSFDQLKAFVKDYVRQQLDVIYNDKKCQVWGVT